MIPWIYLHTYYLVGGFNPFEKYAPQIGSFPRGFGVKIRNIWNRHLVIPPESTSPSAPSGLRLPTSPVIFLYDHRTLEQFGSTLEASRVEYPENPAALWWAKNLGSFAVFHWWMYINICLDYNWIILCILIWYLSNSSSDLRITRFLDMEIIKNGTLCKLACCCPASWCSKW